MVLSGAPSVVAIVSPFGLAGLWQCMQYGSVDVHSMTHFLVAKFIDEHVLVAAEYTDAYSMIHGTV